MRNNEAIIKNSDFIPLIMKLGSIGENVGEIKVKVFFTPSLKSFPYWAISLGEELKKSDQGSILSMNGGKWLPSCLDIKF